MCSFLHSRSASASWSGRGSRLKARRCEGGREVEGGPYDPLALVPMTSTTTTTAATTTTATTTLTSREQGEGLRV
eukprot:8383-Pyramimonas_sp.AAC.1